MRAADEIVFDGVDEVAPALSAPDRAVVEVLDRVGHVAQQPATGPRRLACCSSRVPGDGAAVRGSVCWGAAAVLSNLVVKPFAGRKRPPKARRKH